MSVEPYSAGRTLLVTPSRGTAVHDVIAEALAAHHVARAWIVGRGTLEEVELREAGDGARTLATLTRIVALDGRADASASEGRTLHLSATVTRASPRGAEVFAGEVLRAIAGDLELLVTPLDPPLRHPLQQPVPPPDAPVQSAPESPWTAVAAASAAARGGDAAGARGRNAKRPVAPTPPALTPPAPPVPPRRSKLQSLEDSSWPEAGDFVDHFAFGRGRVMRSDGDEILVHDPDGGRTRTLRLTALQLHGPLVEADGTRLFRLTQKRSVP